MDLKLRGAWLLLLLLLTAAMVAAAASSVAVSPPPTTAAPANGSFTSCAEYKTCDECVASSYTCHFCEFDFQCHVIGSPSGCITGISTCHHLEGALAVCPC